jgi:hypothetical protein
MEMNGLDDDDKLGFGSIFVVDIFEDWMQKIRHDPTRSIFLNLGFEPQIFSYLTILINFILKPTRIFANLSNPKRFLTKFKNPRSDANHSKIPIFSLI